MFIISESNLAAEKWIFGTETATRIRKNCFIIYKKLIFGFFCILLDVSSIFLYCIVQLFSYHQSFSPKTKINLCFRIFSDHQSVSVQKKQKLHTFFYTALAFFPSHGRLGSL